MEEVQSQSVEVEVKSATPVEWRSLNESGVLAELEKTDDNHKTAVEPLAKDCGAEEKTMNSENQAVSNVGKKLCWTLLAVIAYLLIDIVHWTCIYIKPEFIKVVPLYAVHIDRDIQFAIYFLVSVFILLSSLLHREWAWDLIRLVFIIFIKSVQVASVLFHVIGNDMGCTLLIVHFGTVFNCFTGIAVFSLILIASYGASDPVTRTTMLKQMRTTVRNVLSKMNIISRLLKLRRSRRKCTTHVVFGLMTIEEAEKEIRIARARMAAKYAKCEVVDEQEQFIPSEEIEMVPEIEEQSNLDCIDHEKSDGVSILQEKTMTTQHMEDEAEINGASQQIDQQPVEETEVIAKDVDIVNIEDNDVADKAIYFSV